MYPSPHFPALSLAESSPSCAYLFAAFYAFICFDFFTISQRLFQPSSPLRALCHALTPVQFEYFLYLPPHSPPLPLQLYHIPLMLLPLPLRDFHYFRFNFSVVYFGKFLLVRVVLFYSPSPSPPTPTPLPPLLVVVVVHFNNVVKS